MFYLQQFFWFLIYIYWGIFKKTKKSHNFSTNPCVSFVYTVLDTNKRCCIVSNNNTILMLRSSAIIREIKPKKRVWLLFSKRWDFVLNGLVTDQNQYSPGERRCTTLPNINKYHKKKEIVVFIYFPGLLF